MIIDVIQGGLNMETDYNMDCCITKDRDWFRYRATAIIIEDDCILMASNDVSVYYYSVGGGVHLGETAEEAVIREVLEETGVNYEIERLAFIHENFFEGNGTTAGLKCHEIAFYFLMKSRGTQLLNSNSSCAEGQEYMNWIPINELKNHTIYPTFFTEKLINIPNQVEHIVTRAI